MKVIDSAFRSAFMAQPQIIEGLRLLPFSLAHAWFLTLLDCSLLVGGESSEKDFSIFFLICQKSFQEIKDLLASGEAITKEIVRTNACIAKLEPAELLMISMNQMDNFILTPLKRIEGETESIKLPMPLFYAAFLMEKMGMTETQAWDCSWSLAASYFAAFETVNGKNNLLDSETLEKQQKKFHL